MAFKVISCLPLALSLLLLLLLCNSSVDANTDLTTDSSQISTFTRHSFPHDFVFGSASAAYQVEGAANIDGKGPSMWDTYTHKHPEKIQDGSNGDVAVDQYHRYKEDVAIMKNMNLDAYRFSISWPRILPSGKLNGGKGINHKGIEYYDNLINELLSKGIRPYVTIFHWDVPQALEDEYGGFLSDRIVPDFVDFAELCFQKFGNRVKHWMTVNEPGTFSKMSYAQGLSAPGRCSSWMNNNCTGGDSGTEPYIVGHNLLLAHAAAVHSYRTKFKAQGGEIGIVLDSYWSVPLTDSDADGHAVLRSLDFMFGWFMGPVTYGRYPPVMEAMVGKRLPKFTHEQAKLLKGSYDFIGLNYYTSAYVTKADPPNIAQPSCLTDSQVTQLYERNNVTIGPQAGSSWIYVYPEGIKELLLYIKREYQNPFIYISENGYSDINDPSIPLYQALNDHQRIDYHYRHLLFLREAMKEGVRVVGYFSWSLLDNFEWIDGYTVRFGLNFVDYQLGLRRHSKRSAVWFQHFLKR